MGILHMYSSRSKIKISLLLPFFNLVSELRAGIFGYEFGIGGSRGILHETSENTIYSINSLSFRRNYET